MNLTLLEEICQTPGAPGHEERIRAVVIRELEPLVDELRVDALGNVITHKKGKKGAKKLMLAAHMDEIGFLVRHIDDNGYLRFATLGGFDPKTLVAQRVLVHTKKGDLLGVMGTKPIHVLTDEEKKAPLKIDSFYIDVGLPAKEVQKRVTIGDTVTRERTFTKVGDTLSTKSMDDRVGVFVMIEAVRKLKRHDVDLFAVATVQEEVGLRGAATAANEIRPDIAIALDVTLANDVPDIKPQDRITELGKGAAIKVMDSSFIAHRKLVEYMVKTATTKKIPYQLEVLTAGGTDSAAMQKAMSGAIAGCVSIPCRYVHQVIEMCHPDDIQASIDLLAAVVEGAERAKLDW
jgi:endoglucanase